MRQIILSSQTHIDKEKQMLFTDFTSRNHKRKTKRVNLVQNIKKKKQDFSYVKLI